ncbi:hypothetical protein [Agaricicola taiwanensis]|uniref:hypothetical protein n=1 Tax=Agaricicola taiwanensis TaxID=591372 RepID=UPI00166EAA64|nr:hypothetical protein [Agaricicola taiwanensis]
MGRDRIIVRHGIAFGCNAFPQLVTILGDELGSQAFQPVIEVVLASLEVVIDDEDLVVTLCVLDDIEHTACAESVFLADVGKAFELGQFICLGIENLPFIGSLIGIVAVDLANGLFDCLITRAMVDHLPARYGG